MRMNVTLSEADVIEACKFWLLSKGITVDTSLDDVRLQDSDLEELNCEIEIVLPVAPPKAK